MRSIWFENPNDVGWFMAAKERERENKILLSVNVLRPLRVLGLFSSTYSLPSFTTLSLLRRITLRGF